MSITATPTPAERSTGRALPVRLVAALLLLAILLILLLYERANAGRIYPGVGVAGVALGRLAPAEALDALAAAGLNPQVAVVFHAAGEQLVLQPGGSGVALDIQATVAGAFAYGREGRRPIAWYNMLAARLVGRSVQPVVRLDPDQVSRAVADLAAQFDRPATDASLAISGTIVAAVTPAPGRRLDQAAAIDALRLIAATGTWPPPVVDLAVESVAPTVGDATAAVAAAESLLAGTLTLRAGDDTWELAPETLGTMLTTEVQAGIVALQLDEERLGAWMAPVTEAISRTAQLPRFHFDPDARRINLVLSGRPGQLVDLAATSERIRAEVNNPDRLVRIAITTIPPSVADSVTAEELGISELVHEETSYFAGSPPERKHNIAVAASRFDGVLVPPEAVFSFNEQVGDISKEEGYEETKIIMDGATVDGVGGGVCQVSTTLFRTVFWAGLPIVERLAHGYRVAYYEQRSVPGLDATVYGPIVDLKFRNDTGAWLLIETESNERAATVTFRLYGTSPSREIRMEGPVVSDVEPPPPPRTEVDPELAPGETETLELERSGASVRITRIIVSGGEETRDVFHSKYRPTGALTAVGVAPGEALSGADQTPGPEPGAATPGPDVTAP